jgi:hypothetical protein
MNRGANVPPGVLCRFESDRVRGVPLRPRGDVRWVRDWFRAWPAAMLLGDSASGEDTRADFGRVVLGEADEFCLANGLLRTRGPVGAGALMLCMDACCSGRHYRRERITRNAAAN